MSGDVNKTTNPPEIVVQDESAPSARLQDLPDLTEHTVELRDDQSSSSQYREGPITNQLLIAPDIRGVYLKLNQDIRSSDTLEQTYGSQTYLIRDADILTTYLYRGSLWTIFDTELIKNIAPSDPQEIQIDDNDVLINFNDLERRSSSNAFFKERIQLLRTVLEDFGLYRSRATFVSEIKLLEIPNRSPGEAAPVFTGFRVEAPAYEDGWIEVFEQHTIVGGRGWFMNRLNNEVISSLLAGKALHKLVAAANMLKQIGIAMDSWRHVMIQTDTGDISLGEGDYPVLLNANLLMRSQTLPEGFLRERAYRNSFFYFPNLITLATKNPNLRSAEERLFQTVRFLKIKGEVNTRVTNAQIVQEAFDEFVSYIDFHDDVPLVNVILRESETVKAIIDEYIKTFPPNVYSAAENFGGLRGLLNFLIYVLPGIMKTELPINWWGKAFKLLVEAKKLYQLDYRKLDRHWADVAQMFVQKIMHNETPGGGDEGGSAPSNDLPSGGGLMGSGGWGMPPIGQARSDERVDNSLTLESARSTVVAGISSPSVRQVSSALTLKTGASIFRAPALNVHGSLIAFRLRPPIARPSPLLAN